MDQPGTDVFSLDQESAGSAMLRAAFHRLDKLRALAVVMQTEAFQDLPLYVMQGYAWALTDLIGEMRVICFALGGESDAATTVSTA